MDRSAGGRRWAAGPAWAAMLALALGSSAVRAQERPRPPPHEPYRGPRVRLLAEGDIGGSAGREGGLGGGVAIGVGLQIDDFVAVYAQHRVFAGDSLDGPESGGFGHSYHSLVADLTLFDSLQLGVGPSIDFGIGALCPVSGAGGGADGAQHGCRGLIGPWPGMDVRLALAIQRRTPARRRGLVIAAHVHPTWLDDGAVISVTLGAGFVLD